MTMMPRRNRKLDVVLARLCRWISAVRSEKPLVVYLMILPVVGGLPILLFAGLLINQLRIVHEDAAKQVVARQAEELQLAIDRDIKSAVKMLQVLATSHALLEGDYETFYQESAEAGMRTDGQILLVEPKTFRQIFNTLKPYGEYLPQTSAVETARDVVTSVEPRISGVFHGKVSNEWVFDIAVPVTGINDHVTHVLMLAYNARHILAILGEQELVSAGRVIVVDAGGRIIAHSADHEKFVGSALPEESAKGKGGFGLAEALGRGVITAQAHGSLTGWSVIVSTPLSALNEPYQQTWNRLLFIGAGVLLLSIALATHFGRTITRPASLLAEKASALGRGEVVTADKTAISEVNGVGEALARASRQISEGREIEGRLATVLRASGEAIYSLSADDVIETWNPAAERLFGYSADEIVGKPIDILVPDENRDERRETFRRARLGESVTFETRRRRKDGECFAAAITVAPLSGGAGFVSVAIDISHRKAHEERITFLMQELSHRTKNLLAVIQSIASQTARSAPSLEAFQDHFGARLLAIAATHDALVGQNWYGASVQQVVDGQLAAIVSEAHGRASTEGPDFLLKPGVAESLGMALHELAVNAIKYGAFLSESGRVHIRWTVDRSREVPHFIMSWVEEGGPPTEEPKSRGFGHAVMKDVLERRTKGHVDITFTAEGLRWTFEAPIDAIMPTGRRFVPWASAPGGPD